MFFYWLWVKIAYNLKRYLLSKFSDIDLDLACNISPSTPTPTSTFVVTGTEENTVEETGIEVKLREVEV
jgi:hypothetical protein